MNVGVELGPLTFGHAIPKGSYGAPASPTSSPRVRSNGLPSATVLRRGRSEQVFLVGEPTVSVSYMNDSGGMAMAAWPRRAPMRGGQRW